MTIQYGVSAQVRPVMNFLFICAKPLMCDQQYITAYWIEKLIWQIFIALKLFLDIRKMILAIIYMTLLVSRFQSIQLYLVIMTGVN